MKSIPITPVATHPRYGLADPRFFDLMALSRFRNSPGRSGGDMLPTSRRPELIPPFRPRVDFVTLRRLHFVYFVPSLVKPPTIPEFFLRFICSRGARLAFALLFVLSLSAPLATTARRRAV